MVYFGGRKVDEIILHCADVGRNWSFEHTAEQAVSEVDRWHRNRGWKGIGYHYVIMPDGSWCQGRDTQDIGAHTLNRNAHSIGVLLCEKEEIKRLAQFSTYFTRAQWDRVVTISRTLGISKISGHNDYANKLCPGFKVPKDFLLYPPKGV